MVTKQVFEQQLMEFKTSAPQPEGGYRVMTPRSTYWKAETGGNAICPGKGQQLCAERNLTQTGSRWVNTAGATEVPFKD